MHNSLSVTEAGYRLVAYRGNESIYLAPDGPSNRLEVWHKDDNASVKAKVPIHYNGHRYGYSHTITLVETI